MIKNKVKKINSLTVARGFAAWWVVFFHFREHIWPSKYSVGYLIASYGYLAVDFFFILSGFVIQHNYGNFAFKFNWESIKKFFIARLARIYPIHLFMNFIFLLNPFLIYLFSRTNKFEERYDIYAYYQSLFLVHAWGFGNALTWNVPSWSISVELVAYLSFPILSWILLRRIYSYYILLSVVLIIMLAILTIFYFNNLSSLGQNIDTMGIFRCVLSFSAGMILQRIFISLDNKMNKMFYAFGCLLLSIIIICFGCLANIYDYYFFPSSFFLILLFIALADDQYFSIFRSRIMLLIGELSYATYLCHYFVMDWVKFLFVKEDHFSYFPVAIYLIGTLFFSIVLNRLIEVPGRHFIKKLAN